jgi:hypothetical protein
MADAAVTDPADQDPISQTFTAGNALNAKQFIDMQFQMANQSFQDSQRSVRDLDEYRADLRTYKLQAMARSEALVAQSMAMVTAVNTAAATALFSGVGLGTISTGQQEIKSAQTTPPVYQDPTNGTSGANGLAALSAQVAALTQFVQGLSVAPKAAA